MTDTQHDQIVKENRAQRLAAGIGLAVGGAVAAAAVPAFAEGNSSDSDTALARVQVDTTIALTMTDDEFLLTGVEGDTPTEEAAVKYNVRTNNQSGYSVTVQPADDQLRAKTAGNTDTIDVSRLQVRETGSGDEFQGLDASSPTALHSQSTRSSGYREEASGDNIADDYRINIPFVNSDEYQVTLNYTATAEGTSAGPVDEDEGGDEGGGGGL